MLAALNPNVGSEVQSILMLQQIINYKGEAKKNLDFIHKLTLNWYLGAITTFLDLKSLYQILVFTIAHFSLWVNVNRSCSGPVQSLFDRPNWRVQNQ